MARGMGVDDVAVFRVTVRGKRRTYRWRDEETGGQIHPPEEIYREADFGPYGPYRTVGAARATGSRESRGLKDVTIVVERASLVWERIP